MGMTIDAKRLFTEINWQYCSDLNVVNNAIKLHDKDWEGLTDANDIISITFDTIHGCYVVIWRCCIER